MTADGERLDKLKAEKLGDSGRESLIAGICVKGQNDKQFTVSDYDGEKLIYSMDSSVPDVTTPDEDIFSLTRASQ